MGSEGKHKENVTVFSIILQRREKALKRACWQLGMLNSGVCMVPRRSASALLQGARSELGRELGWLYYASFPFSLALYFYGAGRGSLSLVAMLHWIGKNHKQTFSPAKVTWQDLQYGWLSKGSQQANPAFWLAKRVGHWSRLPAQNISRIFVT